MTSDRDRLIELVDKAKEEYANDVTDHTETDYIVECLLNNGVIVPPCKVGDTVYRISTKHITKMRYIQETKICRIAITEEGMKFFCECNVIAPCIFGKTVFLTKEEAEAKLKEREG